MYQVNAINWSSFNRAIEKVTKHYPYFAGVWKARQDGSSFRKFPMYFSKFKPFTVGIETCVAFYPAKNFDGKVRLLVAGALFVTEKGVCLLSL